MNNHLRHRFESQIKINGDRPFFTLVESNKTTTFEQFYSDVKEVSFWLQKHCADSSVVVVLGKNSYEFAVYAVAIILSGKIFFPLNMNESQSTIEKLLSQLEKKYFLLTYDDLKIPFNAPDDFIFPEILPDSDIIYMATSATTGDSKIVRQRESSLLANIDDLIIHHELNSGKKIATSLPLFHVNALHFSFFCSLLSGGQIYLFENFNPRLLFETIEKEKIQIVSLIPILLNNIILNFESLKKFNISSLEYFVSAAAPLSTSTVENIQKYFGKRILQGYGLSEAINFSCILPRHLTDDVYAKAMINEKFPTIGVALKHSKIKILNESKKDCAEGESGEILLAGEYIMPGYLGANIGFEDGFLLTGDLGYFKYFEGEKFYFISGRKKEVAKISGESVSLREYDEELESLLTINNDFISTYFENSFRGEELAVIFTVKSNDDVQRLAEKFKSACKNMPAARIPKVLLFIKDKSLRTASGKAKRFAYREEFEEFKEKRFLNQQIVKEL